MKYLASSADPLPMVTARNRVGAFERFFEWAILGMVGSGYLAIALSGAVDAAALAVAGAAILFRGLLVLGLIHIPFPDWAANVAALAYIGFYAIDYQYLSREFLPATVHLVFFLASVLLMRARTPRDYFFLQVIALLEVLAASILSTGLSFLIFLAVFMLCGIAALIGGEIRSHLLGNRTQDGAGRGASLLPARLSAVCLFVFVGVGIMTAGLFVVLPRTAHAAMRHFLPERFHLPGFSNEVRLGQIGEIQQSRTPVMHIRIYDEGRSKIRAPLKWRGSALANFDGKRWFNEWEGGDRLVSEDGLIRLASREQQWRKGPRITYDVQLKSITGDTLFFTGVPEFVRIDAPQVIRSRVGGYRTGTGWRRAARYIAYSFLEPEETGLPVVVERLDEAARGLYLGTGRLDPRVVELSRRLTAHLVTQAEKARAIEHHLRSSYRYTLVLLDEPVEDPVAHFLFTRKMGHCEYFASAMALMLRAVDIPSRIATGFQDGVYNPVSGWRLIRTSDAHSWVEAFLDGRGWTSFDPTPADLSLREQTLWSQAVMYLDAMEVFWQEWVMSYDVERQVLLADRMGRTGRSVALDWAEDWEGWWRRAQWIGKRLADLPTPSVLMGIGGALIWLGLVWWCAPKILGWWRSLQQAKKAQRGEVEASDATVLYARMLHFLKRQGAEKPAWMTPREFSDVVQPGDRAVLVRQFTSAYHELRYGGDRQAASRMVALLEEMEGR
ncbi:MAG: DUF3488 domain-containing protein [Acidobacteriia bacterium]|nr:DUF3488 domain-containing protein [Terriglobia bacterium]